MFKNLKQKTLNSSGLDSSLLSVRSVSSSSLVEDNHSTADPNVSVLNHRHQSLESLSSINEDLPPTPRAMFGNLEDIIDDLKAQIGKKDNDNKKLQNVIKERDKRVNELEDNCKKEEEGRLALERAYEKLEDTNEVNRQQLEEKLDAEKVSSCNQLQNQIDKLKKDNDKLSKKKNNSADAVAWQNKAESLEKAYQELVEVQEHCEIQIQKMKDLIKMKDDDLQALQDTYHETEERCRNIQLQAASNKAQSQASGMDEDHTEDSCDEDTERVAKEDLDALNWQVASYQQEIEALEKHVVKLELELEDTQQKSGDKDFRINRLREDMKNKDLVIDTQKCDSLELANAVDRTQNLLTDVRTELEVTRSSYTKSLSDLQEDIDTITSQYKECKQECRKQTELVEQLGIAASATKTLKSNLQDDLDDLKAKLQESEAARANHAVAKERQQRLIESLELKLEKHESLYATILSLREELAASQQNEEELKQENDYLTVARESWSEERNELEADFKRQLTNLSDKRDALKQEVELFRRSSQATILPVSSSLQAKFFKGVTEVDIATRKDIEEELHDVRDKCKGLEIELASKTKQLKQNQQHLSDMKRTLQDELRGGSNVSPSTSRASPALNRKYEVIPVTSTDNAIKNSNDGTFTMMEPINLEYLKHCVVKFMCCLDNETAYLLKVISVLLHFTDEEFAIVQEALRARSSWFRSRPKSVQRLKSTR